MRRRALSTIVGAVFFVIVMGSTISYVSYSMDLIDNLARSVDVKQDENMNRQNEELDVLSVKVTAANKFNVTILNSGNIPVNITRLYVENTTDSSWNSTKFDIGTVLAPGEQKHSIVSSQPLTYLSTESYVLNFVTGRGNTEKVSINSGGNQALYTDLFALPDTVPTGFNMAFLYTVVNNSTGQLINISVPDNLQITKFCTSCDAQKQSGPNPKSYPSIAPGDIATFEWTYRLVGEDQDLIQFNATLENAFPGVWDEEDGRVVLVSEAQSSGTSLTAGGLGELSAGNNILVLHEETSLTPNGEYQIFSAVADAGNDGTAIDLDSVSSIQFLTKNSTKNITVAQGDWTASMQIQSSAVPTTLIGDGEDLVFHFEDGFGFATIANSEGDSSRDLEAGCDLDPTFAGGSGPHGSGAYKFDADGGQKQCFQSSNNVSTPDDNDIGPGDSTTALWFRAEDTSHSEEEYLVYWEDNGGSPDYYKISMLTDGTIEFEFDTNFTVTCQTSNNGYDDGLWYHVIVSKTDSSGDSICDLSVFNYTAQTFDTASTQITANDNLGTAGVWVVGANKAQNANYFDGWIDDVMHWDDYSFTSAEVTDLHQTNYGTQAHQIDLYMGLTDQDGNNPTSVTSELGLYLPFSDPKAGGINTDSSYIIGNATIPDWGSQLDVLIGERLNFTIAYVPSTATWENLELYVKLDDDDFSPHESFIELPDDPTNPFPSYQAFDVDENMRFFFSVSGSNGVYLTQGGTRLALNATDGSGAFGALPHYVNDTVPANELLWDRDSIYFNPNDIGWIEFWRASQHPTDDNPFLGPAPVPGLYEATIWIIGYDDQGNTFERSFDLGVIILQ